MRTNAVPSKNNKNGYFQKKKQIKALLLNEKQISNEKCILNPFRSLLTNF